jgi:hypothetical protein
VKSSDFTGGRANSASILFSRLTAAFSSRPITSPHFG